MTLRVRTARVSYRFAAETMMGAPLMGGVSSLFECWAEAEARIRNGEVSP